MHYLECLRAQRRTRKEVWLGNTLPLMVEGSEVHLKEGRVTKCTTLGMRNDRWWKNTKIFFCDLILMGGLPRLKFLKSEKFPKAISILAISRRPSI